MPLAARLLPAFGALILAASAHAQAAVEYALKSGSGALSGRAKEPLQLGACRVDSDFVSCVARAYPLGFRLAIVGICLIVLYSLVTRLSRRA